MGCCEREGGGGRVCVYVKRKVERDIRRDLSEGKTVSGGRTEMCVSIVSEVGVFRIRVGGNVNSSEVRLTRLLQSAQSIHILRVSTEPVH